MSRNRLFGDYRHVNRRRHRVADFEIILPDKNTSSYVSSHYHEYARDANGIRYVCTRWQTRV